MSVHFGTTSRSGASSSSGTTAAGGLAAAPTHYTNGTTSSGVSSAAPAPAMSGAGPPGSSPAVSASAPGLQQAGAAASTSSLSLHTREILAGFRDAVHEHLYNAYLQPETTDCTLHLAFSADGSVAPISSHRLMLTRSPVLADVVRRDPSPQIHVEVLDPAITYEAMSAAIAFLYSPDHVAVHISPSNCRAILACAWFLGIEALVRVASEVCMHEVARGAAAADPQTLESWLAFLFPASLADAHSSGMQQQQQHRASPAPSSDGSTSQGYITGAAAARPNGKGPASVSEELGAPSYGPWGQQLRDELVDFLTERLPNQLGGIRGPQSSQLASLYAVLPFELFKHVLESPKLPASGDQERFAFGKAVVAERKRRASSAAPGGAASAAVFEETVVLAFGGGPSASGVASNVNVMRKPRRKPLWKVGGGA